MTMWKLEVRLGFFFSKILSFVQKYKCTSNQNGITFDWTERTILPIGYENALGFFFLYNFTLNSLVKNLISRC